MEEIVRGGMFVSCRQNKFLSVDDMTQVEGQYKPLGAISELAFAP